MTKFLFITVFLLLQKVAVSQLIITGGIPGDTTTSTSKFEIDTLRINGDSTFYEVSKFEHLILIHREQQISIDGEQQEIIFHGKTEQWYQDGSKKLEGQFEFGDKKGLWKYWDKEGNLSMDIDRQSFETRFRGPTKYFIDRQPVEIRKE